MSSKNTSLDKLEKEPVVGFFKVKNNWEYNKTQQMAGVKKNKINSAHL